MTKAQLELRCSILGNLLFEAIHLLSVEDYADEEREETVSRFLRQCNKEGFA